MAQHTQHAPRQWLLFTAIVMSLFVFIWIGWSLTNRNNALPWAGAVHSDTTVDVGLRDAPPSLDIRTQTAAPVGQALLGNVYQTIVGVNERNELTAGLASSWKISKNALTYTFTLRPDTLFSNGHALDASDAVWSLQQTVDKHYPGFEQLGNLKSVSNPDTDTLVITLNAPNPKLLRVLSTRLGIVFDQQTTIDYANTAVGSGPFVVSEYVPNSSITLRRNSRYSGTPSSSQVTLRYFDSDDALIKALHNGDIQMGLPHMTDLESVLTGDPTLNIAQGASTTKVLIGFNANDSSIFSDQRVRQSTRYLIDANAALASRHDVSSLLGGPISALEPGYEDLTNLFPHDVNKARSMLSYFSSNYLGTVVFLVPQDYRDIGENITAQMQSTSPFTVQMQVVDDATLQKRLESGDYSMALMTMSGTGDASTFADANSVFHYTNGDAQRQYAEALNATTDADYQNHLRGFARTVSQDAAADWLYTRKDRMLVKTKLHGYQSTMNDERLELQNLLFK